MDSNIRKIIILRVFLVKHIIRSIKSSILKENMIHNLFNNLFSNHVIFFNFMYLIVFTKTYTCHDNYVGILLINTYHTIA